MWKYEKSENCEQIETSKLSGVSDPSDRYGQGDTTAVIQIDCYGTALKIRVKNQKAVAVLKWSMAT